MSQSQDVTGLLARFRDGDREAFDQAVPIVYRELEKIARGHLRRTQRGASLDTQGLVHEVYLKLARQEGLHANDRGHFLAIAARAMRQVVIGHARARSAQKRGAGEVPVTLDEGRISDGASTERMIELDDALERLKANSARMATVVECRFFAGLSEEETAEALGVSLRTAQREWHKARAWLKEELLHD